MELQNIRRIAVFKMRNIGDVLLITPVLRALRETFPEAKISVVVNSGTEAVLANNPHVDEVLVYDRERKGRGLGQRLRGEVRFAWSLRRRKFDLTIGLTEGDRTAWYSLLSGARVRIGMPYYSWKKFDLRRLAYHVAVPATGKPMHEVERPFWFLAEAGLKLKSLDPGPLCLIVPEDLRAWARAELAALRPARIVHIHPVSRWLWKCWGNEAMAEIIDWLQTERGARVVMTTGPVPRERERAREILRLCRTSPRFYDGNLSLNQSAALSAEADVYLGVDTGPTHMAAAVGTPMIALFGPTHAKDWGPWTPVGRVLSRSCPCDEARSLAACEGRAVRACLAAIPVAEVRTALDDRLACARFPTKEG